MDQTCNTCGTAPRPKMPAAVAAALVAAQQQAKALPKAGLNKTPNYSYSYTTSEQLIDEGRSVLGTVGLALFSAGWYFTAAESRGESASPVGRVHVTYELVHTGGESYSWESSTPVVPGKGRPEDKAEFASLTANLGYTIRGLLLIPRDDEAAAIDQRDDSAYSPTAAAASAPALSPGSQELEAQMITEIGEALHVGALPAIAARVDAHAWPAAAKERIKAAYAARKAKLLEAGDATTGLADEYIAQFAREATLESLLAVQQHIRTMTWEPAEIERIRSAYNARKAEIQAAQKNGANAAAAAAQGAAA